MEYYLKENEEQTGWNIVRKNEVGDEGDEHVVATFYEYIKASDYVTLLNSEL